MLTENGLAKLIEECGELVQAAGKRLAYPAEHPDGGPPIPQRLEEEIADVLAACEVVILLHNLNGSKILSRRDRKLKLFLQWHEEP